MSERGKEIGAISLALLGVVLIAGAAIAEFVGAIRGQSIEIPHAVYYAGALFGFVGFYLKYPVGAKDAGNFVVTSTVRFIGALTPWKDRRASAGVAVVTETEVKPFDFKGTPPAEPDPPRDRG